MNSRINTTDHIMQIIPLETAHRQLLAQMIELYSYDFSAFAGSNLRLDDNGRFGYRHLEEYFSTDSARYGFLVQISNHAVNEWAGFALVNTHTVFENSDFWMAEFFIMRKFRRGGAGRTLATEMFERFRGRWEIGVTDNNPQALAFWRSVTRQWQENHPSASVQEERSNMPDKWRGIILRFDTSA